MTRCCPLIFLTLFCAACGSSSPTAPAPPVPTPTPTPTPTPPPVAVITVSACPDAVPGIDLGFYKQIGCNAFDTPLQPVRRWTIAPKVYLKTVDEAGAPIDPLTLDTVQNAMIDVAPKFTAGRFGLEGVLRGTDTREGQTGWITVKWPTSTSGACGSSDVATDGGVIELRSHVPNCDFGCGRGAIRPRTARHELGQPSVPRRRRAGSAPSSRRDTAVW
jgi:hypothetical protein